MAPLPVHHVKHVHVRYGFWLVSGLIVTSFLISILVGAALMCTM